MKRYTLLFFIFVAMSCTHVAKEGQMPPLKLKVASVEERQLAHQESFTSQTQPLHNYVIQPRVAGYLKSINYAAGASVLKGEKLFVIDGAPYSAELARQKAQLASAKAELTQATNLYNRNVPLARINAVSQTQLEASLAQLEASKESVNAAKAVVESARLSLGYTIITASGDGIAAQTSAVEGDYVGPGTQFEVLTTIADNDSIVVNLSLPTTKYYQILRNQKMAPDSLLSDIEMILPDGSLYPQKGRYRFTRQSVDSKSGAIVFQVAFANKDGILRAGEFVRINVNIGKMTNRLLIPQPCVDQRQGLYNVWVITPDNTAQYTRVTVGRTFGPMWEITSGLKVGQRVASEGFAKLRDGMKVEPIEN